MSGVFSASAVFAEYVYLFACMCVSLVCVLVCVCLHDKQINKTCLAPACRASRAARLNPVRRIIFAPFHCQ